MSYIEDFKNDKKGEVVKNFDNSTNVKIKKIDNKIYKLIEQNKSSVLQGNYVFLEPLLMKYVAQKSKIQTPKVLAIEKNDNSALFVTENVEGIAGGFIKENNAELLEQANALAEKMKTKLKEIGIERKVEIKDIIFKIENGKIVGATLLDFERVGCNENLDLKLIQSIAKEMGAPIEQKSLEIVKKEIEDKIKQTTSPLEH